MVMESGKRDKHAEHYFQIELSYNHSIEVDIMKPQCFGLRVLISSGKRK